MCVCVLGGGGGGRGACEHYIAAADVKCDTNARLKTFDYVISSQPAVMKKALAKRLADSGVGYQRLNNLYSVRGT